MSRQAIAAPVWQHMHDQAARSVMAAHSKPATKPTLQGQPALCMLQPYARVYTRVWQRAGALHACVRAQSITMHEPLRPTTDLYKAGTYPVGHKCCLTAAACPKLRTECTWRKPLLIWRESSCHGGPASLPEQGCGGKCIRYVPENPL